MQLPVYTTAFMRPFIRPSFTYTRAHRRYARYTSTLTTPRIYFVLGGPGSGKGTQSEMIRDEYHMRHLSAGEILRNEMKTQSPYSKIIRNVLDKGGIVPAEITTALLKQEILRVGCPQLVIDGFPRNMDNLRCWKNEMTGVCDIGKVVFIECSEEEMERRLRCRGREDDTDAVIRNRLEGFRQETLPVVAHLDNTGVVVRVDGNRSKDEVFASIKSALEPCIVSN